LDVPPEQDPEDRVESRDEAQPQPPLTGVGGVRPEIFGKYYLLDRIAIGGMAEVFRAKTFGHSGFEKTHVIKRILGHYAQSASFEAMFVDEAKLSVQLSHPNIVHIYDFGKIESNLFLDMEAVDGKNLKLVMRRLAEGSERMPVKLAVYVAHEIAKGLDYAHRKNDESGTPLNIVHRDISPANILLSYEGGVKIVDFGIARADSTQPEPDNVIKGKFQYMSPEQATLGKLDNRSDLFSAGICLWEMLTGKRLFQRSKDVETVEAIASGRYPLPSSYNPAVPSELDRLVLRALALDPEERYPNGSALQRDLQDFLSPDTPDRVAPVLSTLLRERFAGEIEQERGRLEAATALVAELHYGGELDLEMDEEIEEPLSSTIKSIRPISGTPIAPPPAKKEHPLLYFGLALLLILGAAGLWFGKSDVATTGTLIVNVSPPGASQGAAITLNGKSISSTTEDVVPDVQHVVRVTAPGFVPRDKTVEIVAGQVYAIDVEMTPEVEATPEEPELPPAVAAPTPRLPQPPVASGVEATPAPTPPPGEEAKPMIAFDSEPQGARVYAEGKVVGRTPFVWKAPAPETAYPVEFRLPGYNSEQAVARSPKVGVEVPVFRDLSKKEAPTKGRLSVTALPGWARVYINGEFVKTTPLYEHEITPGTYKLRLTNERLSVDIEDTVSIEAGEVTRKSYRLDE
jgi:serine/threonine protein kinase